MEKNTPLDELAKENEALRRRIDGMRAKEQEFKRFKSRYQDMLQMNQVFNAFSDQAEREVRKMKRALYEIANAPGSFRRRAMKDYAGKVLRGLGYETP